MFFGFLGLTPSLSPSKFTCFFLFCSQLCKSVHTKTMVDLQTVCCMCGDVGFPDKLFRCDKCRHRFQHSYCSNYYGELPEIELCDWCQSEEKNSRHIGFNSKKPVAGNEAGTTYRSEYSGERIKQHDREESGSEKGKSPTPSPRTTTRRYKLLKDVMC